MVEDGRCVNRGGVALNLADVVAELEALVRAGGAWHNDVFIPWNVSRFLIEELVVDEAGVCPPRDFKLTVLGGRLLWALIGFRVGAQYWVAFVDSDFALLPPALDPATLWRVSGTLVCTDPSQLPERPACWELMVQRALRLGEELRLFARVDWYADATHGPLLGEVTIFPHILQPRSMYSAWANALVRRLWRGVDGCAPLVDATASKAVAPAAAASTSMQPRSSLLELIPHSTSAWCVPGGSQLAALSFEELRAQVESFDLTPWGAARTDRVALLLPNGAHLASCLLATMSRYCAVPLDARSPVDALRAAVVRSGMHVLLTLNGSAEAAKAASVAAAIGVRVVELLPSSCSLGAWSLPTPPAGSSGGGDGNIAPSRLHDQVLLLRTSGSTGEPRSVGFSLRRLQLAGIGIASSLGLSSADSGLNMLPLHHIGGISCNLIAPLCAGCSMLFLPCFDASSFCTAADMSWCYAVPAMWEVLTAVMAVSGITAMSDRQCWVSVTTGDRRR